MDLYALYISNYELIYFVYGLAFFLMGFAILLQMWNFRNLTNLMMAKILWLLALFGIAHGLAEWSYLFIPIQTQRFGDNLYLLLEFFQYLTIAVSFLFLFYFGIRLLTDIKSWNHRWNYIPFILFSIWFTNFVFFRIYPPTSDIRWWLEASETWIRYLLALPGALACSLAFYHKYQYLTKFHHINLTRHFRSVSVVFLFYALAAGLIVPPAGFFPASLINTVNFFKVFLIPIQIIRALCGVLMAYFIIRGLAIFEYETRKNLEIAQKNNTLLKERARISRDLHDGSIQSIYAVGLNIDQALYLVDKKPEEAKKLLETSVHQLDELAVNIREYIMGLRAKNYQETDLAQGFSAFLENFQAHSLIHAELDVEGITDTTFAEEQCNHIYHMLNECLNNVIKHAQASEVKVKLTYLPDKLLIEIMDNGVGCNQIPHLKKRCERGKKQGLSNIMERIDILGGNVEFHSEPGKGTHIRMEIPMKGWEYHDQDSVG